MLHDKFTVELAGRAAGGNFHEQVERFGLAALGAGVAWRQVIALQKEQEALEKYTELFGYDGLYYKKVDELVKPLRDIVSKAVEVVAKRNGLDYVFDKAADVGIIYSNPVHDYTEFVLEELGLKQGN